MGITVYEMATGNPPLANIEPMRAISIIPKSTPPRLPDTFSPVIREFVDSCLSEHPTEVKLHSSIRVTLVLLWRIIAIECR